MARRIALIVVGVFFLAGTLPVMAQPVVVDPLSLAQMVDDIVDAFEIAGRNAADELQVYALQLFLLLATIEIAWWGGKNLLRGAWWAENFWRIVPKFMLLIFFLSLIQTYPISRAFHPLVLVAGWEEAGREAATFEMLDPGNVIARGSLSMGIVLDGAMSHMNPLRSLAAVFMLVPAMVLIFIGHVLIALAEIIAMAQARLVVAGGVLFFAWAGSRWTASITESFLVFTMRTGVKIFVLKLVVASGIPFWDLMAQNLERAVTNGGFKDVVVASWSGVGAAFVWAVIALVLPSVVAHQINWNIGLREGVACEL